MSSVLCVIDRCGDRKMTSNITLGIMEVQHEHSGDESDDDVDDVVEQSPCGRWEKRRQEASLLKLSSCRPHFAFTIKFSLSLDWLFLC